MATTALPSQEILRQLLDYDPETGVITWRQRGPEWFTDGKYTADRNCRIWNTRYAGTPALTVVGSQGYLQGTLLGRLVRSHRVIWKLFYGLEPIYIDHINGLRVDNRIANLRSVSHEKNLRNQRMRSTNSSGATGICWDEARNRWRARIKVSGRDIHLGRFASKAAAIAARDAALIEHGFHESHGK